MGGWRDAVFLSFTCFSEEEGASREAPLQRIRLRGRRPACSEAEGASIPRSGRSPGGGNGNPLQHSCLENPRDRGAWRATVHGVAKE